MVLALLFGLAPAAYALPSPSPLRFSAPTPAENATVSLGTVAVRLDAACSVNTNTLVVTINDTPIPPSSFLPFSACSGGRMLSQPAVVNLALPDSTISSAPSALIAGGSADFSGSGTGTSVVWNFDGGAAPASGSPVTAVFNAAGDFTVRLQARQAEALSASAMDGSNLVTAVRSFQGGDPTPATAQVTVVMPAEVDFRNYESSHVHPLGLSELGTQLYAVNTPESRLAIFNVTGDGSLSFAGDVPVGLEPVSLTVRPASNEVWVANHLSDDVSIVDVSTKMVVGTIHCGDEPTDIVFASGRAFVSLAGNQDRVKVYDASSRAQIASLSLFADDPRALATSADGTEVYAVVLESGNRTTAVFTALVGSGAPPPNPPRNPGLGAAPAVGLIVQFNPATGRWEDEIGADWTSQVAYALPDNDLFVIDADAPVPSILSRVSGVGTILFDVAARPGSPEIWVPNTDARNLVRFEPNLRGHLVHTRVSKVTPATGMVTHVDLNPHIDYGVAPGPPSEVALSLSQPGNGVFDAAGTTYYLTAFGSRKVAVLNGAGAVTDRIDVGGGPSGVALNEALGRLYVLNRFDNTVSMVDTGSNIQTGIIGVAGPARFDPSPDVIKQGRRFLYDAALTSGHGDVACATCHVFGNFDNLAWDLGDPQGPFVPYSEAPWVAFAPLGPSTSGFDPMKGPMTTQTLRGLLNLEPFHWRGDRRDFQHFNGAFVALMGMNGTCGLSATPCASANDCLPGDACLGLSEADMDAYTEFIMTAHFPPNPFRNLNDTMPAAMTVPNQNGGGQTATGNPNNGRSIYINNNLAGGVFSCNLCHLLPTGTTTNLFNGNLEGETQDFKIPHLRNMYEKVGFDVIRPNVLNGNPTNIGLQQQKKGFGFLHDGSVSLTEFLAAGIFTSTTQQERDLFAFMLAFGTESIPCIGRQQMVDVTNKNDATVVSTISTLIAQADTGGCDLIIKGTVAGVARGYAYNAATHLFDSDSLLQSATSASELRAALADGDVVTCTGVPPGSGRRLGIDRDRDSFLDRTETVLGTDPANPNSNPWQHQ